MKILESGGINYPKYNIQWEITHACNYNCDYCIRPLSTGKIPKNLDNYKKPLHKKQLEKCIEIIKNMPVENNSVQVLVTGGEPTLHPLLLNIFQKLSKLKVLKKHSLYTNLSASPEFYDNFLNNINKSKYSMFVSYHAKHADYEPFQKRIDILNKHNVNYHIALMLEPDQYEKIVYFVKQFKKNNPPEIFQKIQYHPLANIEEINYDNKFLELEKNNKLHDTTEKDNKDLYYIIEDDTGNVYREEYYLSEMKKLSPFYHSFTGMYCYKYRHIRINPLGIFSIRCDEKGMQLDDNTGKNLCKIINKNRKDNYFFYSPKNKIQELYDKINTPVKCINSTCGFRDDTRCIMKFR